MISDCRASHLSLLSQCELSDVCKFSDHGYMHFRVALENRRLRWLSYVSNQVSPSILKTNIIVWKIAGTKSFD